MSVESDCPLASALAGRMRAAREPIVARWLERIADRVAFDAGRIFPSENLLDHVPVLVDGIADYLEDPRDEISADILVVAKAMELGALRHDQGFELHQILKEYELLGGVLYHFLATEAEGLDLPCSRAELMACAHRLFRAIAVIEQVTATQYVKSAQERVREREQRLRGFNRALSHEIRNRIGVIGNAVAMLGEDFVLADATLRARFHGIAAENTQILERTIDNLIELSRTETDSRRHRHVLLPDAAQEAARQLRRFAESRGVAVRIEELPAVEVPASHVELALSNYLSNAVKYHDPARTDRWAVVRGRVAGGEIVVEVADNGRGIPEPERPHLFHRFFRADEAAEAVEGTGLGLSIVKDVVESVGGRVWADFDRPGTTVFALALPSRREEDRTREGKG